MDGGAVGPALVGFRKVKKAETSRAELGRNQANGERERVRKEGETRSRGRRLCLTSSRQGSGCSYQQLSARDLGR